jgi:hypothetical protein
MEEEVTEQSIGRHGGNQSPWQRTCVGALTCRFHQQPQSEDWSERSVRKAENSKEAKRKEKSKVSRCTMICSENKSSWRQISLSDRSFPHCAGVSASARLIDNIVQEQRLNYDFCTARYCSSNSEYSRKHAPKNTTWHSPLSSFIFNESRRLVNDPHVIPLGDCRSFAYIMLSRWKLRNFDLRCYGDGIASLFRRREVGGCVIVLADFWFNRLAWAD